MSQNAIRLYWVLIAGAILWVAALWLRPPFGNDYPNADIKNDWVTARALLAGDNPYDGLRDLGRRYQLSPYLAPDPDPSLPGQIARTPRTPGALILSLPLTLVPFESLVRVNALFQLGCLIASFGLIYVKTRSPWIGPWLLATLISAPFLWQMRWANVGALLALLTVAASVLTEKNDSRAGGVLLGLAATLKAFPLILIGIVGGGRRYRSLAYLMGTLVVLNGLAFLAPSVRLTEALDAILGAPDRYAWIGVNLSLTHIVGVATGFAAIEHAAFMLLTFGSVIWVWRRPTTTALDSLFLLSIGALASPITWPLYLLTLLPIAAWVCHLRDTPMALRVGTVAAATLLIFPTLAALWTSVVLFALVAGAGRMGALRSLSATRLAAHAGLGPVS